MRYQLWKVKNFLSCQTFCTVICQIMQATYSYILHITNGNKLKQKYDFKFLYLQLITITYLRVFIKAILYITL